MRILVFLFSIAVLRGGWVVEQKFDSATVRIVIGEKAYKRIYLKGKSAGVVEIHLYTDDGVAAAYNLWPAEKLYTEWREMFPAPNPYFVSEKRIGQERIAGQPCERYRLKFRNGDGEVCYAKDISLPALYWARALDAIPMHGIKLHQVYVARGMATLVPLTQLKMTSIVEQDLSPDEFAVPSDYKLRWGPPELKIRPNPF